MKRTDYLNRLQAFAFIFVIIAASGLIEIDRAVGQSHVPSKKLTKASICGNPKVACKTTATFKPNDLPFRVSANAVIYDTEWFYSVILNSVPASEGDCDKFIPEVEREGAQQLFPENKVFTSHCVDAGEVFYTNVAPRSRIMAVYAGTTLAQAKRMLAAVKATGKFPGANLRRMRSGFNGT